MNISLLEHSNATHNNLYIPALQDPARVIPAEAGTGRIGNKRPLSYMTWHNTRWKSLLSACNLRRVLSCRHHSGRQIALDHIEARRDGRRGEARRKEGNDWVCSRGEARGGEGKGRRGRREKLGGRHWKVNTDIKTDRHTNQQTLR